MRIAITNDDGIHAEGLRLLVQWAKKLGEVIVYAPKTEQSGKSHGIELHRALEVKPIDIGLGVTAYTVDSTPADCVRFALLGRKEHFDLIISGINKGLNIGQDIIYSGTVGAAFEAAALGTKAMAVSTQPESFDGAVKHLDAVWDYITRRELFHKTDILNVNIPIEVTGGIRITRQGGPYYSDSFIPQGNDLYMPSGFSIYSDLCRAHLDTDAALHGTISITPLTIDRTDTTVFDELIGE